MDFKFLLDDISSKIGDIIEKSPVRDLEKNIKTLFTSVLYKLDLVTKEEFEVQQQIILNLDKKIIQLEEKIDKLTNNTK